MGSAGDLLACYRRRPTLKWHDGASDVIPMWMADMDWPVAEPIRDVVESHARLGALSYGSGPQEAEAALRSWLSRRHGWTIEPCAIRWTTSVTQGLAICIATMTRPGDSVVLCSPAYPPLARAVREAGRALIEWPMVPEATGFALDIGALRRIVAERRPMLVILTTPHNPTGRVLRREELCAIDAALEGSKAVVVSDEVFADIVYDGAVHVPYAAAVSARRASRTVTLVSASKAFNVAGLKCAAAVFADDELASRFDAVPPALRGAPGILGLAASTAAWTCGQPWLDATLLRLENNRRDLFEQLAARAPMLTGQPPEGTFLAWLDARALDGRQSAQQLLLEHARVDVADGAPFGAGGDGYVRIAFATPGAILDEAITAIVGVCAAFTG